MAYVLPQALTIISSSKKKMLYSLKNLC